jgi:phosphotransferase system  glucose/maltose/N-acetylglucosamine-specific IIC component
MSPHDQNTRWTLVLCAQLAAVLSVAFCVYMSDRQTALAALAFVVIAAGLTITHPIDHGFTDDD